GAACSNAFLTSASVRRWSPLMGRNSAVSILSDRSEARDPVSMLVSAISRRKLSTDTSSSEYKARSTRPSPVTALHRVSDNHVGIVDTLSRHTAQEAEATVAHVLMSLGRERNGAGDGSTKLISMAKAVLLPVPCSPL